jgi:hypothetical protein
MSANLMVDISIEILEKGIKIWNIGIGEYQNAP